MERSTLRAEAYLRRASQREKTAPAPWAAPYISKCIDAGIMSEINGAIDRPGDFLTRQEAAVMHALALETGKTAK